MTTANLVQLRGDARDGRQRRGRSDVRDDPADARARSSLASGAIATVFSRRRVMVGSVAVLTVVTALIPLTGTLTAGSAGRGARGIVAEPFAPPAYAYLSATCRPERLPVALTAVSATLALPERSTDCH